MAVYKSWKCVLSLNEPSKGFTSHNGTCKELEDGLVGEEAVGRGFVSLMNCSSNSANLIRKPSYYSCASQNWPANKKMSGSSTAASMFCSHLLCRASNERLFIPICGPTSDSNEVRVKRRR